MSSVTSEAWISPSGPVHPAAALLPVMPDADIDELAQNIVANRLLEPVVYWADNTSQRKVVAFFNA
jgi:hypothetical protein